MFLVLHIFHTWLRKILEKYKFVHSANINFKVNLLLERNGEKIYLRMKTEQSIKKQDEV